jgi:hypothetical protein
MVEEGVVGLMHKAKNKLEIAELSTSECAPNLKFHLFLLGCGLSGDCGGARLKKLGGPPKQIIIYKPNMQIILYTKNLSCNK